MDDFDISRLKSLELHGRSVVNGVVRSWGTPLQGFCLPVNPSSLPLPDAQVLALCARVSPAHFAFLRPAYG